MLFEVGYALGLGKDVPLLAQDTIDIPVDVRSYQVAVYNPDELDSVERYVHLWVEETLRQRGAALTP